jgi:acetylornithine deacetylase/succinyl-diaminopimelate desuccinylase-like protein
MDISALEGLKDFLRIPSISTLPEHAPDIRRAAEFVRHALEIAGLRSEILEGDGHPLVYGEWLGAPGQPTVLLYGHYDVQPVEPLDEWLSPPFEPEVRNENIYARGAVDDKGQVYLQIKAVEKLMRRDGRLPVNVRFLIEGEEEMGGHHIEQFIQSGDARLRADAALICDTELFAPNLPTLCVGLRGIVYGEIHVQGPGVDLHSGMYGGAAPNAMQAAAEIITALKDRDGRIHIPGLYDRVVPPSAAELEAWSRLPFDEAQFLKHEIKGPALTGESEFSTLERIWARPTFEVHGIRGGFTGEGAKTVIPAKAVVKVSLRLVPDQRPDEVVELVNAAVKAATPRGCQAEFRYLHGAPPSLSGTDSPYVQKAAEALAEVFGQPTVYTRGGGSIPIVGLIHEHLRIPTVLMGFGLPDDNLHAPNEKFHLPNFFRGIDTVALYLERLAR